MVMKYDGPIDKKTKLEFALRRLRKYAVNLESGKNNVDGRSVRIYIDNWVADVFDMLMDGEDK